MALSAVGANALACPVYAGLNVLTQGHFVWLLRVKALAMIAGGIFLVLLFRR